MLRLRAPKMSNPENRIKLKNRWIIEQHIVKSDIKRVNGGGKDYKKCQERKLDGNEGIDS